MSDDTKYKGGRKRMADPATPPAPLKSRLSAAELSESDLESRRYADRMRMRAYRETRRLNRANVSGTPAGVDLLAQQHRRQDAGTPAAAMDDIGEINAQRHQAMAEARRIGHELAAERRMVVELRREIAELREARGE